jgi:ABC-type antimicrobial peptide transport system permease subunit
LRLVLKEGVMLILIGTVLGKMMAFGAARAMATTLSAMSEITKTSIHDPVLLIGTPVLLAGLALLACYLPARRSLKINPVEALRAE